MATIPLLRLSLRPTPAATTTHHHRHRLPTSFSLLQSPTLKPPSPPLNHKTPLFRTLRQTPHKFTVKSSSSPTATPATDRLISAVAYLLPLINGVHYGRFLFAQYPSLSLLFEPLLPIFSLFKSVPYASFVSFFALYLGVVRNPSLSRYVRFNAMQALVLDVLLVLPLLFQRIFTPGRSGIGFKLMVMSHNALFVFMVFCFVYGLVASLLGKTPYLPLVADAAGRQLS